ncbi:MAG: marine proteobacterial sortase target protein [Pseudomonadota bacterium]|nr:marine proteobacterial sortase target protein [Pseudomonadota bacterium]
MRADGQGLTGFLDSAVPAPDVRRGTGRFFARPSVRTDRLVMTLMLLAGPGSLSVLSQAHAIERDEARLNSVESAALLLRGPDGEIEGRAIELGVDVAVSIGGVLAHVEVSQEFRNDGKAWAEGVYVFPLPDNAAVDSLEIRIGERVVKGIVQERGMARVSYETAKARGQRGALVEQERPNLFTVSVSNIPPGEAVSVELKYLQTLRQVDRWYRFRFPLAMTPRYIPGRPFEQPEIRHTGSGWAGNTRSVPDASRISPPVVSPREREAMRQVRLTAALNSGFALESVDSTYHDAVITRRGTGRYEIALAAGEVPMDRDFELVWSPLARDTPEAMAFREVIGDDTYLLLTLMPPAPESALIARPREVVFIIDVSGSMAGASIRQATAALGLALSRLRPDDRFNVIAFSDSHHALFGAPVPADPSHLSRAERFVAGLEASGGTEMRAALDAALTGDAAAGHLRQIVFVTDGSVGNETEIFRLIERKAGDARLFTVGIGSAPNTSFMSGAARFGRGTFTLIGSTDEVEEKMTGLLSRLEHPMVTDLEVDWPVGADAAPERLPDLYAGEPLVLAARLPERGGEVKVRGMVAGGAWTRVVRVDDAVLQQGASKIWARLRIGALMDAVTRGEDQNRIRSEVTALGLRHQLVTRYTSLVAVESAPTRPPAAQLHSETVPQMLPAGQQYAVIFGGFPATATPATAHLAAGGAAAGAALLLVGWRRFGNRRTRA